MIRKKHFQQLADIVGEDFFSAEEYMTHLYSHDIAALPGIVNDVLNPQAEAVAQPTTSEVVSTLLKFCKKENIPVVPRGHGTSGYGGALPTRGGLVVEMTRMNEIYNIDREAMAIEVGSGIIWGKLLEDLEDEGLTVAAYPSSAPSSTVGGWVAAGGSGIGSTKYGGIKEQVVDMEVVLPDGEIIRTQDTPLNTFKEDRQEPIFKGDEAFLYDEEVKDPTEKDTTGLFVDSNGTLGIITKVVLKIIPLRPIRPLTISFPSQEQTFGAMQEILRVANPFYLHFVTDEFYGMLKEVDQAPDTEHPWLVLCALEGPDEETAEEANKIVEAMKMYHGTIESDEIAQHEWGERFYPMRIKRLGPSLAPSEVYVPLDRMDDFLDYCNRHFKGERMAIEGAVNHQSEVAVLAWFLDDERRRIPFLFGWYRSLDVINIGVKTGGRAYSIGMWNVAHSSKFYGKENYTKMSKLKNKTDSKGYLNSHKVFPGPLYLSTRIGILIMLAAGFVVPIAIMFAWWLVPSILTAYVPWIVVNNLTSFLVWFIVGVIIGFVVYEFANLIPISVVLSIGTPFLRWGRKIFH
ncbi:MAG: FAD-binding oxidoreductase [Candidatus Thorarchaeota archaeon]